MSEQTEFINKALKYCNYWAIFINFIVIALCIGGIYYVLHYQNQYQTKTAKVTNVKNGNCEVRKRISSKKPETYFACELDVSYKGNGDQGENVETKNVLFTESVTEYKSGDEIQIDYKKDDPESIRESDKEVQTYMLIFAIVILIITVIATIIRLTMTNNSLVKFWIGFSCLNNITD